jgi:hypothetical protein
VDSCSGSSSCSGPEVDIPESLGIDFQASLTCHVCRPVARHLFAGCDLNGRASPITSNCPFAYRMCVANVLANSSCHSFGCVRSVVVVCAVQEGVCDNWLHVERQNRLKPNSGLLPGHCVLKPKHGAPGGAHILMFKNSLLKSKDVWCLFLNFFVRGWGVRPEHPIECSLELSGDPV